MELAFTVAALAASFSSLISEFGFLPKLVLATEVAAKLADAQGVNAAAQWYGVLLTVIDMGDAISLQLTAPIVSALGITYSNFAPLPTLIGVQAASSFGVLLCLAFVWFGPGIGVRAGQVLDHTDTRRIE